MSICFILPSSLIDFLTRSYLTNQTLWHQYYLISDVSQSLFFWSRCISGNGTLLSYPNPFWISLNSVSKQLYRFRTALKLHKHCSKSEVRLIWENFWKRREKQDGPQNWHEPLWNRFRMIPKQIIGERWQNWLLIRHWSGLPFLFNSKEIQRIREFSLWCRRSLSHRETVTRTEWSSLSSSAVAGIGIHWRSWRLLQALKYPKYLSLTADVDSTWIKSKDLIECHNRTCAMKKRYHAIKNLVSPGSGPTWLL